MGRDKYDNVRIAAIQGWTPYQAPCCKARGLQGVRAAKLNRIARRYAGAFGHCENARNPRRIIQAFAQYTVTLESKRLRDALKLALKRRGIPSAVYYRRPLHAQRAFAHLPYDGGCPVAERLCDTALSLPMHPYLTDDEVDAVVCAVRECIEAQG